MLDKNEHTLWHFVQEMQRGSFLVRQNFPLKT